MSELQKSKALNGWGLFWLVSLPISLSMLAAVAQSPLNSGPAVSGMIQLSVRCAVPLLYIAFAASSVQVLFPGNFGRWLLRNRKYLGLCFAAAMAWQGFFILWLVTVHTDYYINDVYVLRDAIEGVTGYLFLATMTVTSFQFAKKRMSPKQWRLLHKSGIYFLWAYAFSVYWWALFYYGNPVWLDHVYYWAGFSAWGLRAAAWAKKKRLQRSKEQAPATLPSAFRYLGGGIIAIGLSAVTFGTPWRRFAEEALYGYPVTRIPELYLPYWPFEPFLPLFTIALGAWLIVRSGPRESRRSSTRVGPAQEA